MCLVNTFWFHMGVCCFCRGKNPPKGYMFLVKCWSTPLHCISTVSILCTTTLSSIRSQSCSPQLILPFQLPEPFCTLEVELFYLLKKGGKHKTKLREKRNKNKEGKRNISVPYPGNIITELFNNKFFNLRLGIWGSGYLKNIQRLSVRFHSWLVLVLLPFFDQ